MKRVSEQRPISEFESSNFMNICRICLKELPLVGNVSVFSRIDSQNWTITVVDKQFEVCISDIISLCSTKITITDDDGLPKHICMECFDKLRQFYEFHQQIERSDQILHEIKAIDRTPASMTIEFHKPNATDDHDVELDHNRLDINGNCDEVNSKIEDTGTTSCIVCPKTFRTGRRLQIHLIRKHSVRSDQHVGREYKCDTCEKVYTTRANLHIHKRVHSGAKSFKCSECGRAFYEKSALESHSAIHTGQKQFKCSDCGKCFTTANILQQHRKKHSAMKPHQCSICSKAFYTQNELRIHFRMHTQEQPYLCCQCGKRFTRKTHLNIHLRAHSGVKPYKCQVCNKSFTISGDLTAHIRIHTGDRPYGCFSCEKTFNQSSARNIHMRVHTGKRNYICQICTAAFTQSASLKRHVKTHINSDLTENSDIDDVSQS